jgi:hypothetical protein
MAPPIRATRTLDKLAHSMAEAGAGLTATARTVSETVTAASTVIGHRIALGARAVADPFNADHAEFSRMTTEKLEALSGVSAAMLAELRDLHREVATFAAQQTTGAARAVFALGSAQTGATILETQRRFLMESWARGAAHALELAARGAGLSAQVLAPVHETATANARRLTNKALASGAGTTDLSSRVW